MAVLQAMGIPGDGPGVERRDGAEGANVNPVCFVPQLPGAGGSRYQLQGGARPITVTIGCAESKRAVQLQRRLAQQCGLSVAAPLWDARQGWIADLVRRSRPDLLVVDAALVAEAGDQRALQTHRDGDRPKVLLLMNEHTPRAIDIVLATQARGCLASDADADTLERAVRAVAAGELWIPRWITGALYARLVSDHLPASNGVVDCGSHATLTHRELDVLTHARAGLTNKEIARQLDISPSTVKKHMHAAFEKSGLHRRRQLLP